MKKARERETEWTVHFETSKKKKKKRVTVCVWGGLGTAGGGTNGSPWQCSYRVSECMFSKERGVMGGSSMGWNH